LSPCRRPEIRPGRLSTSGLRALDLPKDFSDIIVLASLATKLARRQRATVPCAGSAKAGAFASLRIIGPPVQRLGAPTIFLRFYATPGEPDRSVEQQEEDAPNGLAGWPDFRESRLKGVANELSAGTKRNVIGRSV
jgi:hypothetical protein